MAEDTELKHVALWLCVPCLRGDGSECHSPGCALFLHNSPGMPIDERLYKFVDPLISEKLEAARSSNVLLKMDISCLQQAYDDLAAGASSLRVRWRSACEESAAREDEDEEKDDE